MSSNLIGQTRVMKVLRHEISQAAKTTLPVLVVGETGVGKSVVAQLIHEESGRPGALAHVSLAGLPESLAVVELFGAVRGAFTGATDRTGLIEMASNGTLVLEDIHVCPLPLQARLLNFLERRSYSRLGSSHDIETDVRVISITNADLPTLVQEERFREDFYYRLAGFVLPVPPLRERKADVSLFAKHFLQEFNTEQGTSLTFGDSALHALREYAFPGNVRELQGIVTSAAARVRKGVIRASNVGLPKLVSFKSVIPNRAKEVAMLRERFEVLRSSSILANPIWQGRSFPTEKDYCFVLMPFANKEDLQRVYGVHVKPVVERCGLRCERADDIYDISGVMQSVWESVNRARLVIADLTGRNANVFYEMGIAHTLGKPVIMLTQSMDHVPFDLRHLRCISYQYKPGEIESFEKALEKTIRRVLSSTEAGPSLDALQD